MQILLPLLLVAAGLGAQARFDFWPGASYDPAIPTFQKVFGHDAGDRILSHAGLMKYMETLAAAAPARMKIFEYAKTWEGRKLICAAVGSEANIRRLEEIKSAMKRLADPRRTQEAEARKLMASLPAVIWLGYGVHGNEISSPEAALLTAYHLLAARNDKLTSEVLSNTLVLIDPIQNPDGRDRFVHNFEIAEGLEPDANPVAAEHMEPWPGGRSNHYYFDMNRDWFALTQPETRGRIKALRQWLPLVFVDLHEMGAESTYYFAPEAIPFNPHLTKEQKTNLDWFGKNNAKWFDKFGFSYFTREVFDAFYPGYGASWPAYYGAIAMTYENASARGLVMRRNDDTVFTFKQSVQKHFVASIATCEAAAQYRDKLLDAFWRYRQTAIEEGSKEPVREYILPRRGDLSAVDKLASLLVEQGVEVKRAAAPFGGYPAGTYVVPLAQPAKRLIRTLLDPDVPMEDPFVKEQERRRKKKLPDEIYDVTAWSLPLQYNVECIGAAAASAGQFEDYQGAAPAPRALAKPSVAYLVPWGSRAAASFLTAALRAGLRVHSSDKEFTQNGRKFPKGTLIVRVKENPATLHDTVLKIAGEAEIVPTDTGWVEDGVNFGSNYVVLMKRPRIAMAWDQPASSLSAGHTRFVIERQFGFPVTPVRTQALPTADLTKFDVIILPDSGFGPGYATLFGEAGARRLREWAAAGGTLIGIRGALSWLTDSRVGLLSISQEDVLREGEDAKKPSAPAKPETPAAPGAAPSAPPSRVPGKSIANDAGFEKEIQPDREPPDSVQGVILRARIDSDHWLAAGLPSTVNALFQGRTIYAPIKLDKGVNVAYYEAADKLLASGYLWSEAKKQLAFKPLAVVQREGRGHVIGFTADPNFRAYMDGLNVLFLNAIFRGAAHGR